MTYKHLFTAALAALASLAPAGASAQATLYGYRGDSYGSSPIGLYSLGLDGSSTKIWNDEFRTSHPGTIMLGGWMHDNSLCGFLSAYPPSNDYVYVERDLATGQVSESSPIEISTLGDVQVANWFMTCAYNPFDGRIYGYGFNANRTGFAFKSAPASNLNETVIIRECGMMPCYSVAFNPYTGELFGGRKDDTLVRIDPVTGEEYGLGQLPAHNGRLQDAMCWWAPQGRLIYAMSDGTPWGDMSFLYSVDPATGNWTKLSESYETECWSFLLPVGAEPVYAAAAPQAPTAVRLSADGSTLTFTLPENAYNGDPLSSALTYRVLVNGFEKASGSGNPAQGCSAELGLATGTYTICVVAAQGAATGVPNIAGYTLGGEVPSTPTGVDFGRYTLTWEPVTLSTAGNEIENVEYLVTLNGESVSTTQETSLDMTPWLDFDGELRAYTAGVTARLGNNSSNTALSNRIVVGRPLSLPRNFRANAETYNLCVAEDADGDGSSWSIYKDQFLSGFGDTATDDWLFIPPVDAVDAYAVTLSFEAAGVDPLRKGATLGVYACSDSRIDKSVGEVMAPVEIHGDQWQEFEITYIVPESLRGESGLFLAFEAKSAEGSNCPVLMDGLRVSVAPLTPGSPDKPTDLTVACMPEGVLQAKVSFAAPTACLDGTPLTGVFDVAIETPAGTEYTECTPGEHRTAAVPTLQGFNTIRVYAVNDAGTGLAATASVYTGDDIPGYVENLRGSTDASNSVLTLKWDAPTRGWNGGTLPAEEYSYKIYQSVYDDEGNTGFEVAMQTEPGVTEVTLPTENVTTLVNTPLAVTAVGNMGECPSLSTYIAQLGPVAPMPLGDDFEGDTFAYEPLTVHSGRQYAATTFKWGRPRTFGSQYDPQDWEWALMWRAEEDNASSRIDFPKFSSRGFGSVVLHVTLWNGPDAAITTAKAQSYPSFEYAALGTTQPEDAAGYKTYSFSLPQEMTDAPWTSLSLESTFHATGNVQILADYRVDALDSVGAPVTLLGAVMPVEGGVRVSGYEGETICVYTVSGIKVAEVKAVSGVTSIALPQGVYLVRTGGRTSKVNVGN